MKVLNVSKNSVLTENILVASTLAAKSRGLIGKADPLALFFTTRWGLHTFGMKFPIDCLVCSSDWEIKAMRQNMGPNRLFFWPLRYVNVLELPAGTIRDTKTVIGDKLHLSQ